MAIRDALRARSQSLAQDCATRDRVLTAHAEIERKADGIEKIEIVNLLGRCTISLVETRDNGEEEWRAEGTDSDRRKITAVVVIYEDLAEVKVVTTWANKK